MERANRSNIGTQRFLVWLTLILASLFGLGWLEGRYRFGSAGLLKVSWAQACKPKP